MLPQVRGRFLFAIVAQRWLVAGGGRRRVFALVCCGVGDTHYALFCRDMGRWTSVAGSCAAPWRWCEDLRGGGESRNNELWDRSLGSVSGRPV